MPNSFSSITKIISIFFLIFFGSCSSISHPTFSEKLFIGKLAFADKKNSSNFKISIRVIPENVIIQIGKPLFGNLLKIQFNYLNGISFIPQIDDEYMFLAKNFNKDEYMNFFDSCLSNFDRNKKSFILKNSSVEFSCYRQDEDTLFVSLIYGKNLNFDGVLKRE
jgi:hypothetical protein